MIGSRSYSCEVCRHESRSKRLHASCVNEDVKQETKNNKAEKREEREECSRNTLGFCKCKLRKHVLAVPPGLATHTYVPSNNNFVVCSLFSTLARNNNLKWYEIIFHFTSIIRLCNHTLNYLKCPNVLPRLNSIKYICIHTRVKLAMTNVILDA